MTNAVLVETSHQTEDVNDQKTKPFKRFRRAHAGNVIVINVNNGVTTQARLRPKQRRDEYRSMLREKNNFRANARARHISKSTNNEPVLVTINGNSKLISTNEMTHSQEDFLNAIKLASKLGNDRLKSLASD